MAGLLRSREGQRDLGGSGCRMADLRDWLPADHLAWFVFSVVDEIDLGAFLADYRVDGWGRAAFDPAMIVAREGRQPS